MNACEHRDEPTIDVKEVARTVTTLVLALASMIVMTLAGCANPRGIESKAALVAPTTLGAQATTAVAPIAASSWARLRPKRSSSHEPLSCAVAVLRTVPASGGG